MGLNIKCITPQRLGKKVIGENIWYLTVGKEFLDSIAKLQIIKVKHVQLDFIKIKIFLSVKDQMFRG